LLYTFQSFFCKTFSENYPGKSDLSSKVFTIFSGIVVAFISTAITGFNFSASPATIIIGILCALSLVIYNASLIKASAYGPYSVLMVFAIAGGIIVPAFFAAVFGDKISVVKIICIAIIISAIYLVSRKGNETYTDKKNFFITCTQLALANGAYAIFLHLQQRLTGTEDKEEMVALTYFFAALISATGLALKEKKAFPRAMKQTKKSAIYLIITSLIVASAINLLAYLHSWKFLHRPLLFRDPFPPQGK
jgi:drug/metabolite transporter (DMT)-like permease